MRSSPPPSSAPTCSPRCTSTPGAEGRERLERLAALKIRLLGDRVSRATAWRIAAERDWDDVSPAEYLAVAVLQADAIVAIDPRIAAGADDLMPTAEYAALFR